MNETQQSLPASETAACQRRLELVRKAIGEFCTRCDAVFMRSSYCFLWLVAMSISVFGAGAEIASGDSGGEFDHQVVRRIIKEIAGTQVHQFLFLVLQWALLGAVLGFIISLLVIRGLRALGWYRSGWKSARWIKWLSWGITVILGTLLFGAAGFWRGIIPGSERVLLKSQLGTSVFPLVGDVMADGVARLQVYLSETNAAGQAETNVSARIKAFQEGVWEVDTPKFIQQIAYVQSSTVSNLVAKLEQQAVAKSSQLKDGIANKVLRQALRVFSSSLVQKTLDSKMKRLGLKKSYHALGEKLVSEARQQGNPETISRRELSALMVTEVIVPAVMKPLRSFLRTQELLFIVLGIIAALLPSVGFRCTCGRIKPAQEPGPAASPLS